MNETAACGFPARGLAGSIVNRDVPRRVPAGGSGAPTAGRHANPLPRNEP